MIVKERRDTLIVIFVKPFFISTSDVNVDNFDMIIIVIYICFHLDMYRMIY